MPRPLKFPTKLLIGFDDDAIKAIDEWRRKQDDLPNRSESVRRLVALAMSTWAPEHARAPKTTAGTKTASRGKARGRRS